MFRSISTHTYEDQLNMNQYFVYPLCTRGELAAVPELVR